MSAYNSIIDTVGHTPLVRLNRLSPSTKATIFLKCEYRNPLFSVKDRIAKAMIEDAEACGSLHEDSVIIEPTSGNTGIALAAIARAKGYRCILTMPETMSLERRSLLLLLGAEIILTPGSLGMKGAIAQAETLINEWGSRAYAPRQFENPINPETHYKTTGPEIFHDLDGKIDIFVTAVGTGGTFSGTARYLKEQNPDIRTIAVEPAASPVISGGAPGPHVIQGIGAGFIPANLDVNLIDEVITIPNDLAVATARRLSDEEGIPAGLSSGANVAAALELAARPENAGKTIVTVAPSALERYLSTILAQDALAAAKALTVTEP